MISVRWPFILAFLLVIMLIAMAGCSTLPPREMHVVMTDPPCGKGPDVRLVTFVDSTLPLSACIAAAAPVDKAKFLLLTLIGMPLAACAVTVYGATPAGDVTTVYAAVSPGPALVTAAMTLRSSDDLLLHEIEHAFGHSANHLECRK